MSNSKSQLGLFSQQFTTQFYLSERVLLAPVTDSILAQILIFMNTRCSAAHQYCVACFAVQRYALGKNVFNWKINLCWKWAESQNIAKLVILLTVDVLAEINYWGDFGGRSSWWLDDIGSKFIFENDEMSAFY